MKLLLQTQSVVFVLTLVHINHVVWAAPEYQFSFGRISGVDEQAQDTLKPYNAFYGIPFAEPPVGALRFRAPRPFSNRNDPNRVISSESFRPGCIQAANLRPEEMSEDCLHLNVFTPDSINTDGSLKKVMVWIHGGGYIFGRALEYVPSRLVTDHDVIVVTIQYRLGIFGYLNPGGGKETNFGLRDQILAIRWVKDNIRQFGGDGNDITIFGESAGSTSVSLIALSPLAKGLFTKAIMQSGVALSGFATNPNSEDKFLKVVNKMGCASWLQQLSFVRDQFKDAILDCLRSKSAMELLFPLSDSNSNIQRDFNPDFDIGDAFSELLSGDDVSGPSVDGDVIPRHPTSLLADKDYLQTNGVLDRSYLVGFNNAEGLLSIIVFALSPSGGPGVAYQTFEQPKQATSFAKAFASTFFNQPVTDDVMDLVEYEYTYPRGGQGKTDVMNVLGVFGDVSYAVPTVQFARAITTHSPTTPVYLYLFDHYPELVDPQSPLKGSIHGLEMIYEFDRAPYNEPLYNFYARVDTPTDRPLYNIVRNSWTQFAMAGRPSSQEYSNWPRFDPQDEFYLAISATPVVKQRVFGKKVDLWTKVLPARAGRAFRNRGLRLY